uniref:Uncharacterized protein n=1 Tax=viral metagenome TaxID=1070528 RepID=A0A6C0GZT2_9ZZZZ
MTFILDTSIAYLIYMLIFSACILLIYCVGFIIYIIYNTIKKEEDNKTKNDNSENELLLNNTENII